MSQCFLEFTCEDGVHRCVVDDNGRVAYAYLIRHEEIVGDLWLYNQAAAPTDTDCSKRDDMPFLNPVALVNVSQMAAPLLSDADVSAEWIMDSDGLANKVLLYLHGRLYGVLALMAKPGWCVAALQDGPLAKRLNPGELGLVS
jgi:hypothetical protein